MTLLRVTGFSGVCEIVGPLCEWPPGTESGISCVPFSVHLTFTSNKKNTLQTCLRIQTIPSHRTSTNKQLLFSHINRHASSQPRF